MPETLEKAFVATHTRDGIPVMRNPEWEARKGFQNFWIDATGRIHPSGRGRKAEPIPTDAPPEYMRDQQSGVFGTAYGRVGDVIPSDWWLAHYSQNRSPKGVMVTREAAAAALRACAWPDSSAPCGQAGNSNDDDATFEGYAKNGDCIVRLFMRGKGYFRVKLPRAMFLEIVDE